MRSKAGLACVYSALILADDDVAITGEKIQTILRAASIDVKPYWPGLLAKALGSINVKDLITNVGSGVGGSGAPVAVAVTETARAEKKEEAKKKEESDNDIGFGLFE
jgi:large subunit ribosomal protein LP1